MSSSIAAVQDWLNGNGYANPEGVAISVMSYPGGWCRIKLSRTKDNCSRCASRGPSMAARIMGRCNSCDEVRREAYRKITTLKGDLMPLLREEFVFPQGRELGERYTTIRDGVHDNGAVVTIFVRERNNG